MTATLREPVGGPDNEHFDPIGYVERGDAPDREKLKQLEEWKSELIQLQKATEENMPATGARVGQTAARLAKVTAALELIRERIG